MSSLYQQTESVIVFSGTGNGRASVIVACTLLDLGVTRNINDSIALVKEKRPFSCKKELYESCLESFQRSYFARYPQEQITECINILTSHDDSLVKQEELKTFLELTIIDCQFLFWKYSPIFLFFIRPNFGPFCTFWALQGYFWGRGQVQKLFWDLIT